MKITTLCYIENGGKTLLLHRNKKENDENVGKWIGVGGHALEGESPEDCLVREVYEECGIKLTPENYRFRGIVTFCCPPWEGQYMCLYTARVDTFDITPCTEGELHWVDSEKLNSLPMWEGDRVFFDLIRQNEPFFSLKLVYKEDKLVDTVLNGVQVGR